jgi:hypothetical protein
MANDKSSRNKNLIIGVLVLTLATALIYFLQTRSDATPPAPPEMAAAATSPSPTPDPTHFPVPGENAEATSPGVPTEETNKNDGPVTEKMTVDDSVTTEKLERLFGLEAFARRVVLTVESLNERQTFQTEVLPLETPAGEFQTSGAEAELTLSSANFERYTPILKLAESVDLETLVQIYSKHYSLFQRVYEGTGYKDYFNDLVVRLIGGVLKTPRPTEPIHLVKLARTYKFADQKLEDLSAGQKLLIRMGPKNSARARTLLRALRDQLTHLNVEKLD